MDDHLVKRILKMNALSMAIAINMAEKFLQHQQES